jgi:hypothetical protein
MNNQFEKNLQYVDLLNEWDPFQLKDGNYDPEIADVIQAVYELDDPTRLAKRIQSIYEFSFGKMLPIEKCLKTANDLLVIKENSSCSL